MPNAKQNNEIEHINKEISLLQDRLKINEKSLNQFQNGLMRIGRIRVKQGQRTNLSQTKKIQEILKDIFKKNIKHVIEKADLLKNALVHVKKKKEIIWKRIKENSKSAESFTQNEFNQIAEMHGLSTDELEQITKIRRIKNYEKMTKEELIISLWQWNKWYKKSP